MFDNNKIVDDHNQQWPQQKFWITDINSNLQFCSFFLKVMRGQIKCYRVSSFYRIFPGASYRDFYSTITDDQWLIFFPDMGDFCT